MRLLHWKRERPRRVYRRLALALSALRLQIPGLVFMLLMPFQVQAGTLLVLGDSISAAYGMSPDQGWVHLLAERLKGRYQVVNASVSGHTSQDGLQRLPALLAAHAPDIVVLELGGNDGLRGYPVARLKANLGAMIDRSRATGARVLLLGMEIPPNYGRRYTQEFRAVYQELAAELGVASIGFFLESVALQPGMMQNDGIHPSALAQPLLLETAWVALQPLLSGVVASQ